MPETLNNMVCYNMFFDVTQKCHNPQSVVTFLCMQWYVSPQLLCYFLGQVRAHLLPIKSKHLKLSISSHQGEVCFCKKTFSPESSFSLIPDSEV